MTLRGSWLRLGLLTVIFQISCLGQQANGSAALKSSPLPQATLANKTVRLTLEFWDDDLVHGRYTPAGIKPRAGAIWTSPMVATTTYPGPSRLKRRGHTWETKDLFVSVDKGSLCITTTNKQNGFTMGTLCPTQVANAWKTLTLQAPKTQHVYGLGENFHNPGSADGDLKGFDWDPGYHGFGNQLRGFSGGANGFATFPIAYLQGEGLKAFGFFYDQVYKQRWNLAASPWRISSFGDRLRFFIMSGPDIRDIRRDYMELTGKPPVPPAKAFGFWVSEFGFESWEELYGELLSLENHNFPVDGFGLDIQWFGGKFFPRGADTRGSRMGSLRFDPETFGNYEHEIRHLREARGVDLMAIEEPYVSKFLDHVGVDAYNTMAARGFLGRDCPYGAPTYLDYNPWWGVGGIIDFTSPHASAFWHRDRRSYLVNLGINFHWTDLGEPEMFSENSCYHGFPELGKHRHADIHNIYNLKWAESIARGYRTLREEKKSEIAGNPNHPLNRRPFIMARSGTSGLQRHGAGMWSGDIGANMGAMTAHYNAHMHMSMAGIDYYNSDVGGFHRRPDTLDGDPDELFTQWLANASLFDIPMRSHAWNLNNNLETSPTKIGWLESNRFNVRLRYILFPYYYSLAYRAYLKGEPVIPPLVYAFPADQIAREIGHQKMIGPWLMGAVVGRYGQTTRRIYLPKGCWVDFHTDKRYCADHGRYVNNVPVLDENGIFRLPLFAREGAVIPMKVVDAATRNILGFRRGKVPLTGLKIRVYPSAEGSSFTLYEDDGQSVLYRSGQYAETLISQRLRDGEIRVGVSPRRGNFSGIINERPLSVRIYIPHDSVKSVSLDGRVLRKCRDDKHLQEVCFTKGNRFINIFYFKWKPLNGGQFTVDIP